MVDKMTNIKISIAVIGIVALTFGYLAEGTVYPSYNNETDCRGCHGTDVSDRHHQLVVNGTFQCTDCHPMLYDNVTQTYYPQMIRNCLVCHPGKNHAQVHHYLVQQGLFQCSDCHPVVLDNQTQTYSVQVTWDCTVCHSTVFSIQNNTNITPTPTPTPTPANNPDPIITSFSPISPVVNIVGDFRTFEIMTDQIVNVTWFMNDSLIQSNENVTDASYVNTSASPGMWNVSAVASNINGTVTYNWSWDVSLTITYPPIITGYVPISSPVNDYAGTSRKFGISVDQIANITWYINNSQVQFNENVTVASYTNTSAPIGSSSLNAVAVNSNGSVAHSWTWNVTQRPKTPIGLHAATDCSICHVQKPQEVICYQCHNSSANSANGTNIYSQFTMSNDTYYGMRVNKGYYSTVNTRHDITSSDQNYSSTRLECTDCHSAHNASRTNAVINPKNNTSFNKTMIHPGTGKVIFDYVTFCLKCHDNTWSPNVIGPSIISNISYWYLMNSNKGDWHGAASGDKYNNTFLIGPYASQAGKNYVNPMPCNDCHDSHGSGGLYQLKTLTDQYGINMTLTSNNINSSDVAHWCSHCHKNPMQQNTNQQTKGNCLRSQCHAHGNRF